MAETEIFDQIMRESGRLLQNDILRQTLRVSPILTLMEEGMFPQGMGYSPEITKLGAILPSLNYAESGAILNLAYNGSYWTTIGTAGLEDATKNNCAPPTAVVQSGSTKVAFSLKHVALESLPFCFVDLLSAWDATDQIAGYRDMLAALTKWTLTEFFRHEYTYLCDNKVVVGDTQVLEDTTSGNQTNAATFNISGSTIHDDVSGVSPGVLTNGLLQDWHERLVFEGAGESSLVRENGNAVFQMFTNEQTSYRLKKTAGFVDDWRWSDRSNELLQALGLTSAPVFGIQHMIDSTVPKWTKSGTTWAKVEPYLISVGDKGFVLKRNPAYATAPWMDTILYTRDVMQMCYPGSTGVGTGDMNFAPLRNRGEWEFVNNRDNTYNKDGTIGYYRGIFRMGAKPRYTSRGVIIRHAACGATPKYAPCAPLT